MGQLQDLEIVGGQPPFEGLVCDEILAVQYWRDGALEDPVNVAHLRFGGRWWRLYFDCGIIFWAPDDEGPIEFEAPEIQAEYRVHDLGRERGLVGRTLARIDCEPTQRGSRVTFTFEEGARIVFTCTDDRVHAT